MAEPNAVFTLEDAKRIGHVVRWWETSVPEGRHYRRQNRGRRPTTNNLRAVITQAVATANPNRWRYYGYEVVYVPASSSWIQKTGGVTFNESLPIINGCEANNPASTTPPALMGNGIYCGAFTDVTVTLLPLRGNPVVTVWPIASAGVLVAYYTDIPNAVDVSCNT